jgi:hypothetical protein
MYFVLLSRRDSMIVAGHEVPGITLFRAEAQKNGFAWVSPGETSAIVSCLSVPRRWRQTYYYLS